MPETPLHMLKLCVGADGVEDLVAWQERRRAEDPNWETQHITRMWPKRANEILRGGSLYWVIRGAVLARQRILRLDERIGADGIRRCAIILDTTVRRTEAQPRRPFQGWRYLTDADAPRDLPKGDEAESGLPAGLAIALAEIGVR